MAATLADQLSGMLFQRNGFYALESALHVFPTPSSRQVIGICDWSENVLWRSAYKDLADGCLFFLLKMFVVGSSVLKTRFVFLIRKSER